jgi:hypothetical protein
MTGPLNGIHGPTPYAGSYDLPATNSSPNNVPALPSPADPQLTALMNGGEGDVGAAIAAMVMKTKKELRQSARTSRDAAYAAQESAQRDQLAHMRAAANARLFAGLSSGGAGLASAGFAGAGFQNWAKGFDAAGKVGGTANEFVSSREDEMAKASEMAAETAKRVAEGHADDVKEANESLTKCLEFLKDWLSAKDAARSAAIHRA